MTNLTRREFLKLSAITGAIALSALAPSNIFGNSNQKGVIIILFDAMSACNMSVYGYRRRTTPNLERFAARSTVFHAHNSAGNYTTPGAASLLTGTYPWTHRALNINGPIAHNLVDNNIFGAFGKAFYRFTYSQNIAVTYHLDQFRKDIDEFLNPETFSVIDQMIGSNFPTDQTAAHRAFEGFLTLNSEIPASIVTGLLSRLALRRELALYKNPDYPSGPPWTSTAPLFFELKAVFDGVIETLRNPTPQPRLSYYHLWAPHNPYRPTPKFANTFIDGWKPVDKPAHRFGPNISKSSLRTRRSHYDEYIANVDDEFGRLLDFMEDDGLLENNYVVVTSDHGELFERGVDGHITPLLYDPILHIPLIISSPGQTSQVDITTPTNIVDVLPTLLHLVGESPPAWCEGQILPGLGGVDDPERSTFSVEAKANPAFAPINKGTFAMQKGQFKLIYYTGYEAEDTFEFYDHETDSEELNDLYPQQPAIAKTMRDELLGKISDVNRHFSLKNTLSTD